MNDEYRALKHLSAQPPKLREVGIELVYKIDPKKPVDTPQCVYDSEEEPGSWYPISCRNKGRHVIALQDNLWVGTFLSWQINVYVKGWATSRMRRESIIQGEREWLIGRTFREWQQSLVDMNIRITRGVASG